MNHEITSNFDFYYYLNNLTIVPYSFTNLAYSRDRQPTDAMPLAPSRRRRGGGAGGPPGPQGPRGPDEVK